MVHGRLYYIVVCVCVLWKKKIGAEKNILSYVILVFWETCARRKKKFGESISTRVNKVHLWTHTGFFFFLERGKKCCERTRRRTCVWCAHFLLLRSSNCGHIIEHSSPMFCSSVGKHLSRRRNYSFVLHNLDVCV